jgi:iron complex transport system substrate-binding protein
MVGTIPKRASWLFNCFIAVFLAGMAASPLSAREIIDMYGKKVGVPDKITRVFSVNPSATYMLYAIDPDLLAGSSMKVTERQKPYFKKSYQDLPVLGGAFGSGLNMNMETLLQLKPDVLIVWGDDGAYDQKAEARMRSLNIPVVTVDVGSIAKYADTFAFFGKLLNREKRANELADYIRKTLREVQGAVSQIPAAKRISVYNTRMKDGLNTACENSWHQELIPLAGGKNPVQCESKQFTGIEKINMEKVLLMNPDAIVTMDAGFAETAKQDERWQSVKAVRTNRIYITPGLPINWFDGPPSFLGVLGVQWLAHCLYPEFYSKDIEKEARHFIQLFFGVDAPQEEIRRMIKGDYSPTSDLPGQRRQTD